MNAEQMALIASIVQDIENISIRLMELVRQTLTIEESSEWRPLPSVADTTFVMPDTDKPDVTHDATNGTKT